MSLQINCVIVDADAQNRQELTGFLANYGVQVVSQFTAPDALVTLLNRPEAPQLVIINLDPNAQDTLRRWGHLPRQFPQTSFFLMSQVLDANLLMEAMHLGVREFIPLPIAEDKFAAAIDRICTQNGTGKKGKIIHFIPTMGGCGSTNETHRKNGLSFLRVCRKSIARSPMNELWQSASGSLLTLPA